MAEFERIEKMSHLRIFTQNIKIRKFMISCCEGAVTHCRQKGGLAVVLLHLQAGILGKAVGSAIAPPYLLCRSRAALWLVWAILGIASRPFD